MVERHEGEAVDYDFAGDVGLIRIRPGRRLPATPVVAADWSPRAGVRMTTAGCSEGHDATMWSTQITRPLIKGVDGYPNYEAVECAYAPIQGRSGGGLYTEDGKLAGVCDFAEPTGNHGLYATPRTIHRFLDRNKLTVCYAPDEGRSRGRAALVADNRSPARGRSNVADTLRAQGPDDPPRKKLTIPSPDDLHIGQIDEEDAASLAPPKRPRGASIDSGSPRTLPAELSMSPSVDRDPFEGIDTEPQERRSQAAPAEVKPRSSKAWQPAKK
jgi:hypothetical protein